MLPLRSRCSVRVSLLSPRHLFICAVVLFRRPYGVVGCVCGAQDNTDDSDEEKRRPSVHRPPAKTSGRGNPPPPPDDSDDDVPPPPPPQ